MCYRANSCFNTFPSGDYAGHIDSRYWARKNNRDPMSAVGEWKTGEELEPGGKWSEGRGLNTGNGHLLIEIERKGRR